MNYTLKDESTIITKKVIKKFPEKEFNNDYLKGKFIIKNCKNTKNIQKLKIDVHLDTEFFIEYNL